MFDAAEAVLKQECGKQRAPRESLVPQIQPEESRQPGPNQAGGWDGVAGPGWQRWRKSQERSVKRRESQFGMWKECSRLSVRPEESEWSKMAEVKAGCYENPLC